MKVKLNRAFYEQDVLTVSESLIGKILNIKQNGEIKRFRIVETEAYCGLTDDASHAYPMKKTKRTETMFLEGGHIYVYFIYGMYHCFNVVVNLNGIPQAVLIRAIEPLDETIEFKKDMKTNGPGKLCKQLGIDMSYNKQNLVNNDHIYITDEDQSTFEIIKSKRINIDYADRGRMFLWRFSIKDNKFVSH